MKKEKIYNILKEKFDDLSSNMFTNCIYDFTKIYGEKYITINEIINILVNNFEKGIVIYDSMQNKCDAICSADTHQFKVDKKIINNDSYFMYVLFHEFIHAISFKKCNNKQFMGFYTTEYGDDYKFKSRSFNEVVTEYITLKRNNYFELNIEKEYLSGYVVGVEQLELLFDIIPEDELINAYFNKPSIIKELFEKYHMNIDEIFYVFYILESKEYEIISLMNKRGMESPNDVFKIIDAERYLYYNIFDSIGSVSNEIEFENKWNMIIAKNKKFNLWKLDKLFIYQDLINDTEKIKYSKINEYITEEELVSYKLLKDIFNNDNKEIILERLYDIYNEDYRKYFSYVNDIFAVLAYIFLNNVKNNYQLYDIELYPRVYKYIKLSNEKFDDFDFEKFYSKETKTYFYIFKTKNNIYVETNYDDTVVNKIKDNIYEIKYGDYVDIFDFNRKIYIINGKELECEKIY